MSEYVITTNRQFGSLGRPIARKMSEILHIDYYDRDIVDAVSKTTRIPVKAISNQEETAKSGSFYMKFPLGNGTTAVQDQIFEAQREVIVSLAAKQNCIIVGRCSDYILAGHKNLIRIFIYASKEQRLKNCITNLHMEESEARKMITDVDKARDAYHIRYAKYPPSDFSHCDIMINSGFLGVDGTAAYLSELVKQKMSIS